MLRLKWCGDTIYLLHMDSASKSIAQPAARYHARSCGSRNGLNGQAPFGHTARRRPDQLHLDAPVLENQQGWWWS